MNNSRVAGAVDFELPGRCTVWSTPFSSVVVLPTMRAAYGRWRLLETPHARYPLPLPHTLRLLQSPPITPAPHHLQILSLRGMCDEGFDALSSRWEKEHVRNFRRLPDLRPCVYVASISHPRGDRPNLALCWSHRGEAPPEECPTRLPRRPTADHKECEKRLRRICSSRSTTLIEKVGGIWRKSEQGWVAGGVGLDFGRADGEQAIPAAAAAAAAARA